MSGFVTGPSVFPGGGGKHADSAVPDEICPMNPEPTSPDAAASYKYWAFISYSHADAKWAEWLHKQLETFHVPRRLVGRQTDHGYRVPRRLFPLFRDRDELPGSASLAESIREALQESRYLIVVCSPRSAVSQWVNQEVVTFKAMGRADRVLCLIVDGEPNATDRPGSGLLECFPPAVRHEVREDGVLTEEREDPIAADARAGKDGRRDALIKVASGLLGVGFDELKRREEARRKRMRLLWTVALGVLAAAAVGAVYRIWEEQARANREAAVARAVNAFLINDLLRQAGSEAQADAQFSANPNLTVREALQRAASRIGNRFRDEPLVEAAIREAIGAASREVGDQTRAIEQLESAVSLRRSLLGGDHPDTLGAMDHLAGAYYQAGRLEEALGLWRQVLERRQATLGPEHPDTLRAMPGLAVSYRASGRLEEAISLQEEVLRRMRLRLGDEHRYTLGAMHNLSVFYSDSGRLDEALRLKEEVLRRTRSRLGPEHPGTLDAMDNLALSYADAGRLEEAIQLHEDVLRLSRSKLGPEHPDTLTAMNNLAGSYSDAGRLDEALALWREVLRLRREKLGAEHPDTLRAMSGLALSSRAAGKLDEALALQQEVLRLSRARLGGDHPDTLSAMLNLSVFQSDAHQIEEATRLQEEVLGRMRAKLGADHPDTLSAMNNLANSYAAAGRPEEALSLRETVLTSRRAKLGADHPDTVRSMLSLAALRQATGHLEEALALWEEASAIGRNKLGPDHPDTLAALNNQAITLNALGRLSEATVLLRSHLAGSPAARAALRYNLACFECLGGHLEEARRLIAEEIAADPGKRRQALQDQDLKPIRDFISGLPSAPQQQPPTPPGP